MTTMNDNAKHIIDRNQNLTSCNSDLHEDVLFVGDTGSFDEIEMSFADNAIDFILDLLTDLSVNRGAYALREAFSNAYDATVVAGDMSLPIEIELPNLDTIGEGTIASALGYGQGGASVAIIRDHGCGMTEDDVRLYFTQYGGSKKRSTADMDTIGSKGLGSKAPLAVADTFTVRTTKDGITTTAILERKDGRNYASITAEETGEANGTEVRIPVTSGSVARQMRECADEIARYSFGANVLVNGKPGRSALSETPTADDDYIYIGRVRIGEDSEGNDVKFRVWQHKDTFPTTFDRNTHTAYVLAGVGYELIARSRWSGAGVAPAFIVEGVPGYLNFTPSRDEIKQDAARENFIAALADGMVGVSADTAAMTHLLASMSIRERFSWLKNRYTTITATDEGIEFGTGANGMVQRIPFTITDKSLFVTDSGYDWSGALTGDVEREGEILRGCFHDKKFGVNVASVNYSNTVTVGLKMVGKRDFSAAIEFYVPSLHADDDARPDSRINIEWMLANLTNRGTRMNDAVVITGIKGCEAYKNFINSEKQIRDVVGYVECDYLFVDADRDVTEAERELLTIAYKNVTYLTFEDMMEKVRNARRRAAAVAKHAPKDKVPPAAKQLANVYVGICDLTDAYTVNNERHSAACNSDTDYKRVDFAADGAFDNRVFCFLTNAKRDATAIIALARLMRTCGKLDADELVICNGWSAACVNYAEKNGAKVFYDARTNVKTVKDSIVSKASDIKVEAAYWGNKFTVTITPDFFNDCWEKLDEFTRAEFAVRVAKVHTDSLDDFAGNLTRMFSAEELGEMGIGFAAGVASELEAHATNSYTNFNASLFVDVVGECPDYMTAEVTDLTKTRDLLATISEKSYQLESFLTRAADAIVAEVMRPGLANLIAEIVAAGEGEDEAKGAKLAA